MLTDVSDARFLRLRVCDPDPRFCLWTVKLRSTRTLKRNENKMKESDSVLISAGLVVLVSLLTDCGRGRVVATRRLPAWRLTRLSVRRRETGRFCGSAQNVWCQTNTNELTSRAAVRGAAGRAAVRTGSGSDTHTSQDSSVHLPRLVWRHFCFFF